MSAAETLMVTDGPIPPLGERCWTQGAFAENHRGDAVKPSHPDASLWCVMGWLQVKALDEDGRMLQAINLAIHELFPERVDGGVVECEDQITRFNDYELTTYADVCKVLDEANRRLA